MTSSGYHLSFYLAGRLDSGEATIADFAAELEGRGHRILEPWWTLGRLPKPYLEKLATSTPAAEAMIRAAAKSDVYVLFPTNDILGAAVEFGAAIQSACVSQPKWVYVVGPLPERQSVFFAHPRVTVVENLDALRREIWY